jgi:hypothetical protein
MPKKQPSKKLPSFVKVKIKWIKKGDEYVFDEDEAFQSYSEAMSKLIEEHTQMDENSEIEIDLDDKDWDWDS